MKNVSQLAVLCLFLRVCSICAWSPNTYLRSDSMTASGSKTTTALSQNSYTKGAEIFPACNNREFTLADSFPNGAIPPMALNVLNEKAPGHVYETEGKDVESQSSRRSFMLLASSALGATASSKYLFDKSVSNPVASITGNSMGVAEAIQWIDNNCDRRFLHAVISSDYRFLYRGLPPLQNADLIQLKAFNSDLLSEETYNSPQALDLFQKVEKILEDEVINPSNGHLGTTNVVDAQQWGIAGSIWPIQGAHYSWFQDGGLFYPRPSNYNVNSISRDDLIVDGKDCGRESLEDALLSESCEVMVSSKQFLVVPAELDEKLRDALKTSFLV